MSAATAPARAADAVDVACPYRGLLPFSEAQARYFFGRDGDREIITANLIAARLTLLYSPSGVGKTSVLLAGVLRDLHALADEDTFHDGGPEYLPVVVRRWSGDAIATIDLAIAAAARDLLGPDGPDPPGEARLVDRVRAWGRSADTTLLFLFDQFEEFLLYHGDAWEAGEPARELADVLSARDVPANVLLGLREDALASLDRFKGRVPHLFDNYLRLAHLGEDAAREAITGPIEQWNRDHPRDPMTVEPELVDAVVEQVQTGRIQLGRAGGAAPVGGRGGGGVEAPFLQLVLTRIWEEERARGSSTLSLRTLQGLGGAAEIVRSHLDLHMRALRRRDRDVAAGVFHQLVTPSGTKVARSLDDLTAYTGFDAAAIESVLTTLSQGDWRIVRRVREPGAEGSGAYEIYHDVLAEAVLDWRARHEERRRRARLLRRALGVALIAALVAVAAIVVAALVNRERKQAEENARKARAGQLVASSLLALGVGPQQALSDAREAVELAPDENARRALRAALAQGDLVAERSAGGPITALRVAPDGTQVAAGTQSGRVLVWGPGDPTPDSPQSGGGQIMDLAFSPDGRRIAVLQRPGGGGPVSLDVRRVADWALLATPAIEDRDAATLRWAPKGSRFLVLGGHATLVDAATERARDLGVADQVAWSPAGSRFAVADPGGKVVVRRADGERITAVPGRGEVEALGFTANGADVLAARKDGRVTGIAQGCRRDGSLRPERAAFTPGARHLVTADDEVMGVWTLATCRRTDIQLPSGVDIRRVAVSPDGAVAAATGDDGIAHVWDVERQAQIAALPGGWAQEARVILRPGRGGTGTLIFTAGDDGLLRQWRLGSRPAGEVANGLRVRAAAFGARPDTLVVAARGGVRRIDWRRGGRGTRIGAPVAAASATFSADGGTVAVASRAGSVRVRRVDGSRWRALDGRWHTPVNLALSPDGGLVAVAGSDGRVDVHDTVTGERVDTVPVTPVAGVHPYVLFAPDGRRLVSVGDTVSLHTLGSEEERVLDTRGISPEREPPGVPAAVHRDRLVATIAEGYPTAYDLRPGRRPHPPFYSRVSRRTHAMAISPDGEVLATAGPDGVRLWDTTSDQPFAVLATGEFDGVRFSGDGEWLVATGPSEPALVFACRPCGSLGDLLARASATPFAARALLAVTALPARPTDARLAQRAAPDARTEVRRPEQGVAPSTSVPNSTVVVPGSGSQGGDAPLTAPPPESTDEPTTTAPEVAPTEIPTSPVLPEVPATDAPEGAGGDG